MQNYLRLGARVPSRDATALMLSPAALSGERIPMGDCWTGLRTKRNRPWGCGLDLVEMEGGIFALTREEEIIADPVKERMSHSTQLCTL
jgi:hypothetical protein